MRYLGYQKRELKKPKDQEYPEGLLEIYIFNNPELNYFGNPDAEIIGVERIQGNYSHFTKNGDGFFHKKDDKDTDGIGIHRDYLFNLDKLGLNEISKKIGVSERELEGMLE